MNYIKALYFAAVMAGLGGIAGCNDAKYDTLDPHAYIDEALNGTSQKVTVQASGESLTTLTVHLSNLSTIDNHYKLVTDQSVLDAYNLANGTGYMMLPEGLYTLPESITVKAGQYATDALSIALKSFSQEMMKSGESYALPVKLVLQDGSVQPMANTGTFVILAESIIEFSAPMFVGSANLSSSKYAEEPETYAQYTVEVRFQVSNMNNRNRAIFSNGGGTLNNILLRFEDPQSDNENFKAHSLVQVVGRNSLYLNPSNSFKPNEWQHLALVCDGSSYRLYINGVDSGVLSIPSGATTFSSISWFSADTWWNGCKILMSEARIWSVVRSASQIQNNMTQVSPKSTGLEAYWRFNEGEGNVFEDATGKGHTLTTTATPTWIDGILSTDKATEWK